MERQTPVYHEKQRKQLCALHVLNNLFQQRNAFTQSQLDDICISLTPSTFLNPHRGVLGLGNYDVNVITAALQTRNLCLVWFDKRKAVSGIDLSKVKGVIVNVPSNYKLGFVKVPFDFKHWYVIREIHNTFYNLDSKLNQPQLLGDAETVLVLLKETLSLEKAQVLLVVEPEIERTDAWYKIDASSAESTNSS